MHRMIRRIVALVYLYGLGVWALTFDVTHVAGTQEAHLAVPGSVKEAHL